MRQNILLEVIENILCHNTDNDYNFLPSIETYGCRKSGERVRQFKQNRVSIVLPEAKGVRVKDLRMFFPPVWNIILYFIIYYTAAISYFLFNNWISAVLSALRCFSIFIRISLRANTTYLIWYEFKCCLNCTAVMVIYATL